MTPSQLRSRRKKQTAATKLAAKKPETPAKAAKGQAPTVYTAEAPRVLQKAFPVARGAPQLDQEDPGAPPTAGAGAPTPMTVAATTTGGAEAAAVGAISILCWFRPAVSFC